jgi:hypothetical protein
MSTYTPGMGAGRNSKSSKQSIDFKIQTPVAQAELPAILRLTQTEPQLRANGSMRIKLEGSQVGAPALETESFAQKKTYRSMLLGVQPREPETAVRAEKQTDPVLLV